MMIPDFIERCHSDPAPRLKNDVQPFLHKRLKLGDTGAHESCEQYFAEDPDVAARRKELQARKATLEGVKRELYGFGL
jgi:hypothetical protein